MILHSLDRKAERNSDHERLELIYGITTELSENIEAVLKKVDEFVKIKPPQKGLARIDDLIQDVIESYDRTLRDTWHSRFW